jgi:hypothetical protein
MFKATSYDNLLKMTKVFQRAVKLAQERHKEKGLPNVYMKNGKRVWELPDGRFVSKNPFEN